MRTQDPFEMLAATHESVRERMQQLRIAAGEREDPTRRDDADAVLENVLRWTGRGLQRHEQDEELSLFPRLRRDPELARLCDALAAEHREHELAVAALRGAITAGDQVGIERAADRLAAGLEAHVAREDAELLPRARTLLSSEETAQIAVEMEARRGGGGDGRS